MDSDIILEVSLYALLLFLVLVIRWSRFGSKVETDSVAMPPIPKRTSQPKIRRVRPSTVVEEKECNWRNGENLARPSGVQAGKPSKFHPEKPRRIDIRKAFEREKAIAKKQDVEPQKDDSRFSVQLPPTPPNSPVHELMDPNPLQANYLGYGLDPSFDDYVIEELVVASDEDFERRRKYLKRSVTDGEVMMEVDTYKVCQIFVYGIEYHYVYDERRGSTSWDYPGDLAESLSEWFLVIPKSRRRKLPEPPVPLVPEIGPIPLFL